MARKADDPSPEPLAKIDKQRADREDGTRALDEATKQGIAVRKNMASLRELGLAKEAEKQVLSGGQVKPKKRPK